MGNHGGGYSYRLCKVPEEGMTGLTEECFQKGALQFASDKSWAQWGDDPKNRTEFTSVRSSDLLWSRDPIPACKSSDGGVFNDNSDKCLKSGYQFPPPAP